MSKWLRKSLVVVVSILTFGLVTPSHAFFNENTPSLNKQNSKESSVQQSEDKVVEEKSISLDSFIESMVEKAEENAYVKFGDKIKPVIQDEFKTIILPNIEKAITETAQQFPEEDLSALAISEVPNYAKTEKIFHIYDNRSGKDVIRFHVRRDHPPLDGYYFNFHYHTYHDSFQSHRELGTIYWDKNTPPQWMSVS
jgi:hypothetical protein